MRIKIPSRIARFLMSSLMLGSAATYAAPDPNFHIYLMFGQSNMEGMGTIASQDRATNPRVKVLQDLNCSNLNRYYGNWYVAAPPLNRCWSGIGPGDYFGKTMADNSAANITIGLVPAAVAGSDIALYQKSAPIGRAGADIPGQFSGGYAWLLDLAKKAQTAGVIKGIIFHQGETNTNDPNWKYKVQEIVNNLRSDLGIGNVPFLAGELLYSNYGGCCGSHNTEVNKLPSLISNAFVISSNGLNGADGAHFTTAAYRELGRRYAQTMLTKIATTGGAQCNWYGTTFPVCSNTSSGWGWENNTSCVARADCAALPAPNGIINAAPKCNVYGNTYSICANTTSGWGWENNASCIARADCQALPSPYGVVGAFTKCNWNGTQFPLCKNTSSGWGWENNASCVGINDCSALKAPYGPY